MKKIEDLLKKQNVASASPDFNAKMDGLFRNPPPERSAIFGHRVMLWQALTVSLLTGVFGYWLGHAPSSESTGLAMPQSPTTLYIIETHSDSLRNIFDAPADIEPFYQPPAPPISASVPVEKKFDVTDQISI